MHCILNTMITAQLTHPECHRVTNAKLWHIASPQRLKVVRHTYFSASVAHVAHTITFTNLH